MSTITASSVIRSTGTRTAGTRTALTTHPQARSRGAAPRSHRRRAVVSRSRQRLDASGPRDRGDVPGWVLVTLMTAGLVVAIWAVAGPALTTMFTNALISVTGP